MVNHKIKTLLIFMLGLMVFQSQPKAQEQKTYTFVGTHFPLILEEAKDGTYFGMGKDVLDAISEITGDTFEIIFLPWGRALRKVKQGHADGIIGLYMSDDRKEFLTYSDLHFWSDKMVLVTEAGKQISWDGNLRSLNDLAIITILHWSYGAKFEAHKSNLYVQVAKNLPNGIKMLMHGRGDVLISNLQSTLHAKQELGLKNKFDFHSPAVSVIYNYFGFSKEANNIDFETRFNAALLSLKDTGKLSEITSRHMLSQN